MAIKDTDTLAEYPYVFVVEQTITQGRFFHNSDTPRYEISFAWCYYRIDENGNIHFSPDPVQTFFTEDFYGLAVSRMQAEDMSHVNAIMAQQQSMCEIISTVSGRTLEVI